MKNVKLYLKSSLIGACSILVSCESAPKIEQCIIGESGLLCIDPRLPKGKQEYMKTFRESVNYLATNPDDYFTVEEYCRRKDDKK